MKERIIKKGDIGRQKRQKEMVQREIEKQKGLLKSKERMRQRVKCSIREREIGQ